MKQKEDGYDALALISHFENEARDILKKHELPLDLWEIRKIKIIKVLPPIIDDVIEMFFYFSLVRQYIEQNNISGALCCMTYGVQKALRARIRPFEPDMFRGIRALGFSINANKEKKKQAQGRYLKWQDDADEIWKNDPTLNKTGVAMKIEQKYADNDEYFAKWDTISRHIIKKNND